MARLDGKIAVVTGGSDGMGLASARLFVQEGARVVITGRNEAPLHEAAEKIGADAFRCDNTKMADIEALRAHMADTYGRVDVVFANAGGARLGPFLELTEADFDYATDLNYKGTFFTVQKLVPLMTAGGSILLNTSIQDERGTPGMSTYSATKAAIRSLARSTTAELAARGIRINALSPGFIATDIMLKHGATREWIDESWKQARTEIPMGRIGTVDDIAKAALFLASDDSSFVTGIELTVDGGMNQV